MTRYRLEFEATSAELRQCAGLTELVLDSAPLDQAIALDGLATLARLDDPDDNPRTARWVVLLP